MLLFPRSHLSLLVSYLFSQIIRYYLRWKYSNDNLFTRILTFRITSTVCLFHKIHRVPSFRACNLTYQRRVYRFLCKFYWYPIAVDDSARNVYVVLVIVVGNRAEHMSNDHRSYWTLPIERLFWLVEFFRTRRS